jgi:hypothetical protein
MFIYYLIITLLTVKQQLLGSLEPSQNVSCEIESHEVSKCPQELKFPYPYAQEEVGFGNVSAGVLGFR